MPGATEAAAAWPNGSEPPRFSRSEPLGQHTEKAGAVSQSFKADGATPTQILDFYARRLKEDGWAIQAYSQYSLSLRPAEIPSAAGPPEGSATPAVEETAGFVDRNFKVTPVRDYDPIPDETTFSWEITGEGPAEYVLVRGCRDAPVVFAAGPAGPPVQLQSMADPATGVTGLKWQSGALGTYTVGYKGGMARPVGGGHRELHVRDVPSGADDLAEHHRASGSGRPSGEA